MTTGFVNIAPGALVQDQHGNRFMVKRLETPTKVSARNLVTGEDESLDVKLLKRVHESLRRTNRDLQAVDDEEFNAAYQRYVAIRDLLGGPGRTVSAVDAVAAQCQVNRSTIYRWISDFSEGELVTNLLRKRRTDAGTTKLDPDVEKLMGTVIAEFWLTTQRRSMRVSHRELERLCRARKLVPPSYNTFRARLETLDQADAAMKRGGEKAAQPYRVTDGTVPDVDGPYSVLQIDHTFLDVMLVEEEHRIAIGRPWITVAIDVYSRMVAGYYLSFDPPGTLGTGICIANAILPKSGALARLDLTFDCPCMGKPKIIHLDNAREFRGNTLKKACQKYGINLVYRKVKTPNYGGHIERYLGTLAAEISALPGATFADHDQRAVYDADKKSAMTLADLDKWLANLIYGVYHYREHSSIRMPPLQRYAEGLLGSDNTLGTGKIALVSNEEALRRDFLPFVERTIQHYGVSIDGITYFADVLRRWVGAADPQHKKRKRQFLFRRDPRDISFVLFYDPDAEQYFRIPYRDTSRPPMSLWELRATLRYLAEQGKKKVDENQIFRAYDEMRRIEEQAKTVTRKTRLAQTRRKHHEAARKNASGATPAELAEEASDDDQASNIVPFDEIEQY